MNDNIDELNGALGELIDIFKKHKLRVQDILLVYGNLGYALGASIEGCKGEGPDLDELMKKYHTSPTLGVALMLQGITITSWHDDYVNATKTSEPIVHNIEEKKDND